MKILTISNLYPPHMVGGYEVRCQQVMDRLRARGHDILVLTSNHRREGVPESEEAGIVRKLRIHGFFGHPWLPLKSLYRLEQENHTVLQQTIQAFQPDIIHIWNMGGLSKSLLHRLEAGRIPVVYDVSDHWIARSLRADVWLDWWNRPARGLSGILRGAAQTLGIRTHFDRRVPTQSWEALAWKHIYFCSEFLRQLTADAGFTVQHGEVIYCGVETGAFEKKSDYSAFKRLLFVGRLSEDKDPLTAIRALAEARRQGLDVTLDLFGKGEDTYVAKLHSETEALEVADHIRFLSAPPEKMRAIYAQYDALLFTSNWGEPFALTPLEAMSAGLPVILCPDGGDAELGRDGENCVLAETANPQSVAEGIRSLMQDAKLRKAIADTAIEEVKRRYDLEPISAQIEQFLTHVLAQQTD